jgi:WS/DGAT/MGAT family acyltransferase
MSAIRKLSTVDASFLYLETPEMPMHVGSMAIFKPPADYKGDFFEDFKALIASRLHLAPILVSKLEKAPLDIDNPSWIIDDQFDIDRHIFPAGLPAPADRATLARTVGWMHAKLLNRARPLWEFYVFQGLKDGEIGIYSKVHHACIDGGAGAALTEIVYDVTPVPRDIAKVAAPKPAGAQPRDVASSFIESYVELWRDPTDLAGLIKPIDLPRAGKSDLGSVLFDNAMGQFEQTLRVFGGLPAIAKTVNEIVKTALDPKSRESVANMIAPTTPLNRAISSERSFAGVTVPLSRARALAKAAGGKLNDVVMAISDGGGADLAARGRRRGGEQSGVRHGLRARQRPRRSQATAARDHPRILQGQGDEQSAEAADSACQQYCPARGADAGAGAGADVQPLEFGRRDAGGGECDHIQRAGTATDALRGRSGIAPHLPGLDRDAWAGAEHHGAKLSGSTRFRIDRRRQRTAGREQARADVSGGIRGARSGFRARGESLGEPTPPLAVPYGLKARRAPGCRRWMVG